MIEVMKKEQQAIDELIARLDEQSELVVEEIAKCKGKVVFIALGKNGYVCEKAAATFSSTSIPSIFVHATECYHGDFGILTKEDFVFLVSNSGSTAEVVGAIPVIHSKGIKVCAITKNADSELALKSDYRLLLPDCGEADHLNLVPTSSSTATLVLLDALACAVMQKKDFKKEDFHKNHPGGMLGKQLSKEIK